MWLLFLVLCWVLTAVGNLHDKNDLKIYPVAIQNSEDSAESNNLQDIIDIEKLKPDLPLAMKLYYP